MPLPYLKVAQLGVKKIFKNSALDALGLGGIKTTTSREEYALKKYHDPYSPLYKRKDLIKEYYNPALPIDKDVAKWTATDAVHATNSPLYKYDQQLQNMTHRYIKNRAKKRFNGLF